MPIDPEVRFRDLEHRLAEPSITAEPAPLEQDLQLTRLSTRSDVLSMVEQVDQTDLGPTYRLVSANRLTNPTMALDLTGWMVDDANGVVEQVTVI